jgi:hypothetical protein
MFALALAGAALGGTASADTAAPFRQMRLVRSPSDDLRIEWRARVHETGGEFLVVTGAPTGPRRLVARLPPDPRARYRVTDSAAAPGARVYELRYRDSHGRERLLASIELDLEAMERGPAAASARALLFAHVVVSGAAGFLPAPSPSPTAVSAADPIPLGVRGRPPTPPPRADV